MEFLTSLAPVVVFSAASAYQGGIHHVNEQWPTYWAALFAEHGLVAVDSLRKDLWREVNGSDVPPNLDLVLPTRGA